MAVYLISHKLRRKRAAALSDTRSDEEAHSSAASGAAHDEGAAVAAPAKSATATQDAAKVIEFNEPAQWVERMALTSTRALPADLNADDDPRREEAFIQQTLLSVQRAITLLERAEVPWRRPDDYYAEMYKSDVHMADVRRAMEAAKARVEAQGHRRAMKDQKKFGKEVQAEVLRQRAKYKREMQDRLSDWKKKRKGNDALRDFLNEDEEQTGGAARGKSRAQHSAHARNLRPGGKSKRPGKNARRRH